MTAKNIALGVVIGGAVSGTLTRSVTDVRGKIGSIAKEADKVRMFQKAIGDTQKLQTEIGKVARAGGSIDALTRKFDAQSAKLRRAGIDAGNLNKEYLRLGATARKLDLQARGRERIGRAMETGRSAIGDAVKMTAAAAIPTAISAEYQAIIRDIAIKAGIAGKPQEAGMSRSILAATRGPEGRQFIGRNVLAEAVNYMVSAGMEASQAVKFAPLAAKFAVGQGSPVEETANMIRALEANALIHTESGMQKALETIAYLGKAGSFESKDMAKWFPEMLASMGQLKIFGQDAVTQLGSMLQVQIKVAGSADEAANNLRNWFSKIGAGGTSNAYDSVDINYKNKIFEAINKGYSTLEATLTLARLYIEKTDPKKAKEIAKAAIDIENQTNAEKKKQMIRAFDEVMKTGDLFNDMQVKNALMAYMQNKDLYRKLKEESSQANGELDKDLADRRATSLQIWKENTLAWEDAGRAIGDATRLVTDFVGTGLGSVGRAVAYIAENAPGASTAALAIGGAVVALKSVLATAGLIKGAVEVGKAATGWGVGEGAAAGAAAGAASPGLFSRIGAAGSRALGATRGGIGAAAISSRLALAAPTLGAAVAGGGGIGLALGAGAAGAAGYGLGSLISKGVDKGLSKIVGHDSSLGTVIYDLTHQVEELKNAKTRPPVTTVNQDLHYSPYVSINIQGDVKDTAKLQAEIAGVLDKRMKDFQQKQKQLALHDDSHIF